MKKTIITIALAIVAITIKAQTVNLDSGFISSQSNLSFRGASTISALTTVKDTIPCFFRELTGIVKGNLMGVWRKGYVVKLKGDSYFISNGYEKPFYLYGDKKTKVTNIIIQYYY